MKRNRLDLVSWAGRYRPAGCLFGILQVMTWHGRSRASGSPWEGGG